MNRSDFRPGERCPALDVALLNGDRFDVGRLPPDVRSLIIFYRGLHCPKCKLQLREFDEVLTDLAEWGIRPVAVSMDDEKKASAAQCDWEISQLPIGYGLNAATARAWGLFMSNAEFDYEPTEFCEPGMFVVEPDGTLYAAWIQSTPFARPRSDDLLKDMKFVNEKDYPARGKAT